MEVIMKKLLCAAVAVVGVCEAMHQNEQFVNFSSVKARDIPEDFGFAHTGFIQGSMFVFTCAIDLSKLCDNVIAILSDESKYSPEVNELFRDESLLKYDEFPRSLNFVSLMFPFVPPEKKVVISGLVPKVEEFILKQYTGLCAEYSGFIEPNELSSVESFFLQRLQALQSFPK
jgi:hypothetical protein